jgi:hypothetical protein
MAALRRVSWGRQLFIVLAVAFFLVPAGYGFYRKFSELLYLAGDETHSFVIMPIVNYLLSSLGFCMLLLWATARGMFHDVEKPKYAMLEQERMLEEMENRQEEE